MDKNIIKFTILLGLLFCSCQKEISDNNLGTEKIRLPLNKEIKLETRNPVLLKLFPENSLSLEDRKTLLLLMKWSDFGQSLDYPERIKKIAIQYNKQITNEDLQFLVSFPNVEELYLKNSSKITDEGMSILEKLSQLKTLDVSGTQVTEASLPLIAKFKNLEDLYLGSLPLNTQPKYPPESPWKDQPIHFSDNALKYLKDSNIKNLYFNSPTNISDDGLQYINAMRHLKRISLKSDVITQEAVEKWIPTLSDEIIFVDISYSQPITDNIQPEIIRINNTTISLFGLQK